MIWPTKANWILSKVQRFGKSLCLRYVTDNGKIYASSGAQIWTFHPTDATAVLVLELAPYSCCEDILVRENSLYVLLESERVYEYPLPPKLELEWWLFEKGSFQHIFRPPARSDTSQILRKFGNVWHSRTNTEIPAS